METYEDHQSDMVKRIRRSIMFLLILSVCTVRFYSISWASTPQTGDCVQTEQNANGFVDEAERLLKFILEADLTKEGDVETDVVVQIEDIKSVIRTFNVCWFGEHLKFKYIAKKGDNKARLIIGSENLLRAREEHLAAKAELEEMAKSVEGMTIDDALTYFATTLHDAYPYDYSHQTVTVYKMLKDKKGICHTYASAFYELCRQANITCHYTRGSLSTGELHAWNEVECNVHGRKAIDVANLFWGSGKRWVTEEILEQHYSVEEVVV